MKLYRLRNARTGQEYPVTQSSYDKLKKMKWLSRYDLVEILDMPDDYVPKITTSFTPEESQSDYLTRGGLAGSVAAELLTTSKSRLPLNPQSDD